MSDDHVYRVIEITGSSPKSIDDAIRLGARTVWMQLGVINKEAAERARTAGLRVVMDRCPLEEWGRLALPLKVN